MNDQQKSTETEPLAGINDRRYFDERFADLLSISKRVHCEVSVLMIDLDNFKQFNEKYGESAGDECLRMVGGGIAKSFSRTSDCVAQYGGEEFAIVSLASNIDDLRHHAKNLCERVCALNIPHSDSPYGVVTVSIGGVHRLASREITEEVLLEQADKGLLSAKRNGRDCVNIAG